MRRLTVLITGVSPSSIGLETCRSLVNELRHEARRQGTSAADGTHAAELDLILCQRDTQSEYARSAEDTLRALIAPAARDGLKLSIRSYDCDLTSTTSVRACAAALAGQKLDCVILNAGAVYFKPAVTAAGVEKTHATNVLGHHLLLHELLRARMLAEKCRIVFVGSKLHLSADAAETVDNLDATISAEGYDGMRRYGQSKLLQAMDAQYYTGELAKHGVEVVLVSPGFVPSSGISRDASWLKSFAMRWIMHYLPFARSLQQAGQTIAGAALGHGEASEAHSTLRYLSPELRTCAAHDATEDPDLVAKVTAWCDAKCGLAMP